MPSGLAPWIVCSLLTGTGYLGLTLSAQSSASEITYFERCYGSQPAEAWQARELGPFSLGCLPEAIALTPAPEDTTNDRPANLLVRASATASETEADSTPRWQNSNHLQDWWGTLKSQTQVAPAAQTEATPGDRWQTDQKLQAELLGPLFVFGQLTAGYNTVMTQELKWVGLTGIGCKLTPCRGAEVQLRGGSRVTHAEDPLRPERLANEKSQMLLELEARYPLLGAVNLEYVGAATPALDPLERNRIDQDIRFAVPLGQAGQLRLGAKHTWQDVATPRSWNDGMQLYLGIGLQR